MKSAAASPPGPLLAAQKKANEQTRDGWEIFAPHRAQVTALVREAGAGSLLVLGAGNGNDLDLAALMPPYDVVHLADLDAAALARGAARLPSALAGRVHLHAPIDLAGVLGRLPDWKRNRPTPGQLAQLAEAAAARVVGGLPGGHDVVVSTALLTQLFQSVRLALGVGHPDLHAVVGGVAAAHLRALAGLLRPGGQALLVTDVVSSESYPLVELWGAQDPLRLLGTLSGAGNTFTGADPTFLMRLLVEHPVVEPLVTPPRLVPPWLWTLSEEVTLLVYALSFSRRA